MRLIFQNKTKFFQIGTKMLKSEQSDINLKRKRLTHVSPVSFN